MTEKFNLTKSADIYSDTKVKMLAVNMTHNDKCNFTKNNNKKGERNDSKNVPVRTVHIILKGATLHIQVEPPIS